jgi:hypothetical protein
MQGRGRRNFFVGVVCFFPSLSMGAKIKTNKKFLFIKKNKKRLYYY